MIKLNEVGCFFLGGVGDKIGIVKWTESLKKINVALTRKDTRLKKIVVSAKMLQNAYHVRYLQIAAK